MLRKTTVEKHKENIMDFLMPRNRRGAASSVADEENERSYVAETFAALPKDEDVLPPSMVRKPLRADSVESVVARKIPSKPSPVPHCRSTGIGQGVA